MLAWVPGPLEIGVIVLFGVIIFGKNLPMLARNLGKSFVEFKKGFKDVNDEVSEDIKAGIEELKEVKELVAKETADITDDKC